MHPHTPTTADQLGNLEPHTPQELHDALTVGWQSAGINPRTGQPVVIPGLILELRNAVFGGMEGTGGGAGFASKMPIDSGALDLYETIEREISEAWAGAFPNQIPGMEHVEHLLAQFFAVTRRNPEGELIPITVATQRVDDLGTPQERWWVERSIIELTPLALLQRWVTQIRNFFDPPRRREIMAPCVSCGTEWAWRMDGGEHKPYRVFVFEQDERGNTLAACCLKCDARWGLGQMKELATKISAALLAAQRHDTPN